MVSIMLSLLSNMTPTEQTEQILYTDQGRYRLLTLEHTIDSLLHAIIDQDLMFIPELKSYEKNAVNKFCWGIPYCWDMVEWP